MNQKNMGEVISLLRKQKGMTQSDLAEKMNITDKAVSKWERNLSYPDIHSVPKLAQILDVSVDELLNAQKKNSINTNKANEIINAVLLGVGLAMGVSVTVLSILDKSNPSLTTLIGLGLSCIGIYLLRNRENKQ